MGCCPDKFKIDFLRPPHLRRFPNHFISLGSGGHPKSQNATLTIRKKKGTDVLLSIEKGQFMCRLGCSVMARFDDAKTVRWRATGTADHSTETIFLRKESTFVKAVSMTDVLRIKARFYQQGSRVLKFPVARFDAKKLR